MSDMSLRNDPTADIARLAQAVRDSLTDSMVERVSTTAANALEVADKLNDEQTRDAVISTLDWLSEIHRTGALDTLFQSVMLLHGIRNALTDNMVERLFLFLEHMANTLATEEVADLAHNAKEAMIEAADDASAAKPKGGLLAAASMLSKPENQQALQFLLAFACKMRASTVRENGAG